MSSMRAKLTIPSGPSRLLRALRRTQGGFAALAVLVGVGAGLGAVGFRLLIEGVTRVLSGYPDYSDVGREPNPLVPWLGPYFVLLAPVVAGALYGPWCTGTRGRRVVTVSRRSCSPSPGRAAGSRRGSPW
ncbi:hypothetical protein [Streptomyces sp. NPDC059874]|uniref:hypothetical protein n=1 Tax=Streptomyces sp. NPDC059874 TaxID=3346983 RepID=UPI003667A1F3